MTINFFIHALTGPSTIFFTLITTTTGTNLTIFLYKEKKTPKSFFTKKKNHNFVDI